MSAEPTYPDDAPVGRPKSETEPETAPETKVDETALGIPDADKATEPNRTRNIVTGAAIGIGSAALVAALLYANRSRGRKSDESKGSGKG